jgi:ABC-type uncharacterized transport system ATPase subunit
VYRHIEHTTGKELITSCHRTCWSDWLTPLLSRSALDSVLQTPNMTVYPQACAEATASFAVLSDTILVIQGILSNRQQPLVELVLSLQQHEKEKLNLTAALHLEQIRLSQIEGQDQRSSALLRDGIVSLRERLAACVEQINEDIEEIQCARMEADGE